MALSGPTFSLIFLKPPILRARRACKIGGFRKIGEGIVKPVGFLREILQVFAWNLFFWILKKMDLSGL